jgi:SAM-dependent methyltransferase
MCLYSEEYYKKHENGAIRSAENILPFLYDRLKFNTIADFGCGIGCWALVAKKQFNTKVIGIDFHDSTYLLLNKNEYTYADLTKPISLGRSFDLVISLEVAEHIEESNSNTFLDNLCSAGRRILFSAAFPEQGGIGHVNEKPLSYWAEQFARRGYLTLDVIRPYFWDCEDVDIWYRNNSILIVEEDIFIETINKFEICFPTIDIIHPKMLQRIINRRIG